ncbi:hypothetical protein AX15_000628 [Amanita polypyramis BW_CC]|nr:hypothetical protein AX15_000628 [Amanita polypyramis BW_CC]
MSVPLLPTIAGDAHIILDVYTHSSLRNHLSKSFGQNKLNDEYGDADRLALLGREVLDLAITHHWYRKSPLISAEELRTKQQDSLSDSRLKECIDGYSLIQKLRYVPNTTVDAQTCRTFLDTYIGALYIRNGLQAVQDFVSKLIDPSAPQEDQEMTDTVLFNPYHHTPPQPSHPPPPAPPDYTQTVVGSSNSMNVVSLAVFNQVATQRGYVISWQAESTGPPHQPTWTVRCCLNGVEKGRGTGRSQKMAKEDAIRQAWTVMSGFSA